MFGYGIILPFDEAIGYYVENMKTTVKEFVINDISSHPDYKGENFIDKNELRNIITDPIQFWLDSVEGFDFIRDSLLSIRELDNTNTSKVYIFIGKVKKFSNNAAISFSRVKECSDEEKINRRLLSYGFDINKCDYYFGNLTQFKIKYKNEVRKL